MRVLSTWLAVGALTSAVATGTVPLDPPVESDSFAPHVVATSDGAVATWLERRAAGDGGGRAFHRVRFSRFEDDRWTAPSTVVESDALFANWADTPGVAADSDGALVVWWLERNGESPYAYGVRLARSTNGGSTWAGLGWLHDDESASEHGFVSMATTTLGLRAFWLDGRATIDGQPMTLRSATVGETVRDSTLVDASVCDCCSTAALPIGAAALVAYRDRSEQEIRDIRVAAVRDAEAPARSAPAAADGWRIEGCPVNGPALARAGSRIAVAWFTAPDDRSRVAAAFSADDGLTFSRPLVVDANQPIGRVDLAPLPGGDAALVWHARAGDHAEIRLVRLSPAGGVGPPIVLATTSGGRRSGFARLATLADGRLLALWTEAGEGPTRVRAALVDAGELPGP